MMEFLTNAVTPSRHDAGCIDYEPHEVEGQPSTFGIYERWISREALDSPPQAPRMQELVPRIIELMTGWIEAGVQLLRLFRPV